jgi:hopanoid-associated phosphorylase
VEGIGLMIVVVGLAFEARIAALSGLQVVCGGDGQHLQPRLHKAMALGCRGLISFGVAGGLAAHLRPGTCIVGSAIVTDEVRLPTDGNWSQRLLRAMPGAMFGVLAGAREPVTTPAAKRALHRDSGAVAVDTESHVVALAAAKHDLPMVAIRVVCDPAARSLPEMALRSIRPDGSTDVPGLLRSLVRQPRELLGLLRIALDARAAHATLVQCGRLLQDEFGVPDLGYLQNQNVSQTA